MPAPRRSARCHFTCRVHRSPPCMSGALALGILAPLVVALPCSAVTFHPPLGEVYLSPDRLAPPAACPERVMQAEAWTPFKFYIGIDLDWADVGQPERNATDGALAMEVSVDVPGSPLVVISRAFRYPGGPFKSAGEDDFIIGLGECVTGDAGPTWVIEYTAVLLSQAGDLVVGLGPYTPSTFDVPAGPGPTPGWLECVGLEDLYPFGPAYATEALYINPTSNPCAVPAQELGWGSLKSMFGDPQ